ncbi:MAG: 16S rRNA (cytosine(967)-C(5))-methyltransferase RsmB [Pseudomonadales bacterium]
MTSVADNRPVAGSSRDRTRAARVLVEIIYQGRTTDQSFGRQEPSPLLQELVYGTLRYYYCLDPMISRLLSEPLRTKDLDLRCLMLVGAYQLHYTRIPDHAAIHETVNACRGLKKPWARGLVNAVLRKVVGESPDERSFGLPDWWLDVLHRAYPDQAEALARATLDRAPMVLRVNVRRTTAEEYRDRLAQAGIGAHPGWLPEQLVLDAPVPVRQLPGYTDGLVSVQDAGAQFAGELVAQARPPASVLDACAAPGGKLFHLAERLAPGTILVGVERSPGRLEHLQDEARRLGHEQVILRQGDATTTEWLAAGMPERYDGILLDAPCSGSGTLRRHPDIKLRRRPEDLPGFVALQQRLLENLWRLLAPVGTLTYCTCSVFPEENDGVVGAFLAAHPDATSVPIGLPTGRATTHGWQLMTLPHTQDGTDLSVDGFYFARLTRQEKAR